MQTAYEPNEWFARPALNLIHGKSNNPHNEAEEARLGPSRTRLSPPQYDPYWVPRSRTP